MPLVPGALFLVDPQKKPAFEEHTIVTLTKDYTKLYGVGSCSKYLKKSVGCLIIDCAIFSYTFNNKTRDFTDKLNDIEWCQVEISTPIGILTDKEEYVKAMNLVEYVIK